ncbi:hypothetical protein HK101_007905 [Irineochytrium annulatum]|nr:hypothetical protein HK101_007905 [Irineochytrium annulatum]
MSISDEALKRAFIETQVKLQTTTRQLSAIRAQVGGKERERRVLELTAKELKSLPAGTVSYKAVGKAFMKEDLAVLVKGIEGKGVDAGKEVTALERASKKLESEANDAERGLREILGRRS